MQIGTLVVHGRRMTSTTVFSSILGDLMGDPTADAFQEVVVHASVAVIRQVQASIPFTRSQLWIEPFMTLHLMRKKTNG